MGAVQSLYGNTNLITLSGNDTPTPPDLLDELMANLRATWKAKGVPYLMDEQSVTKIAEYLFTGILEGYGVQNPLQGAGGFDYDTPDANMLNALKQHTFQFSAAKNYQELKAIGDLLSLPNGKLRTWSEFKAAAYELHTTMNVHWLKSEYNFAIASGQMAGKWVGIEKEKRTLPLLQFDAVMDQRTSGICRSLEGIIRPVDDPFWNQYYPPNHWGCRSTVRQLRSGVATPMAGIEYPEVHSMFKVNLGQQRLAFPPSHPYFVNNPKEVADKAKKLYGK